MIRGFESGGIGLEQCHHALISTILESHLAFSWPTLSFFRGESALYEIVLSSLSDVTFHLSDILVHERNLAHRAEE